MIKQKKERKKKSAAYNKTLCSNIVWSVENPNLHLLSLNQCEKHKKVAAHKHTEQENPASGEKNQVVR